LCGFAIFSGLRFQPLLSICASLNRNRSLRAAIL
jgi:hypothetical protein